MTLIGMIVLILAGGGSSATGSGMVLTVDIPATATAPGGSYEWTVTVHNQRAQSAAVTVVPNIEGRSTFTTLDPRCAVLPSGSTASCPLDIPAGATITLPFTNTMLASVDGELVAHGVFLMENNTTFLAQSAFARSFSFSRSTDMEIVYLGSLTTAGAPWNLATHWQVRNNGPTEAKGYTFGATTSDPEVKVIDEQCLAVCATGSPTLQPGEVADFYVHTSGPCERTATHTVIVYHGEPDPVLANDTASVVATSGSSPCLSGGGGGGGGSGGGGSGAADLHVTGSVEPASAPIDGTLTWRLRVDDENNRPATGVYVDVTLPAGVQVSSTSADRGPGCTSSGTGKLRCSLDWLSSDAPSGNLTIVTNVTATGELVLTATAGHSATDPDPADNTLALIANTPVTPPPVTPPIRTPSGQKGVTKTGTAKRNVLVGTAFADILRGLGGNDSLNGKASADKLYGGAGNDTLLGGPGADLLEGGPGNDTINARDGIRDTIHCGTGNDTVAGDNTDTASHDCEIVRRA